MSFKAAITRVKIELLNVDAVHIQRLQLIVLAQSRYTLILLEELGKLFIVVVEVFLVEHLHRSLTSESPRLIVGSAFSYVGQQILPAIVIGDVLQSHRVRLLRGAFPRLRRFSRLVHEAGNLIDLLNRYVSAF